MILNKQKNEPGIHLRMKGSFFSLFLFFFLFLILAGLYCVLPASINKLFFIYDIYSGMRIFEKRSLIVFQKKIADFFDLLIRLFHF